MFGQIRAAARDVIAGTRRLGDVEAKLEQLVGELRGRFTALEERLAASVVAGPKVGGLYSVWTPRQLPGIFTHFRSGQRVILDPRDPYIAVHFLETGEWEEHLEPVWQEYLAGAGSVFVDVGANIGIHSIRATKYGAHIHAFEPDPLTYAMLSLNLVLNGSRTISVRNAAVSSAVGRMEFAVSAVSSGLSGLTEGKDGSSPSNMVTYSVDAVPLDDVVKPLEKRGLLKIDVEGHESSVLQGGERFIRESIDLGIVLEYQAQPTLIKFFKEQSWFASMYKPMMYQWGGSPRSLEWERLDEWCNEAGDLVLRKRIAH